MIKTVQGFHSVEQFPDKKLLSALHSRDNQAMIGEFIDNHTNIYTHKRKAISKNKLSIHKRGWYEGPPNYLQQIAIIVLRDIC